MQVSKGKGTWGRWERLRTAAVMTLLLAATIHWWAWEFPAAASNDASEVRRIATKLQCPVCEGTSVADSRAAIAQDMRRVIEEKFLSGTTEQQILDYFVERYGAGVLRDPPTTGLYAAIWWVPVAVLLMGTVAVIGVTRRRRS